MENMIDTKGESNMTKGLTEKPLACAQRQSGYRERKKRQDIGTDQFGFLAKPTPSGAWATVELKQLERTLALLLAGYEEWEKEVVYAELPECARLITKKYEKAFAGVRAIEQAEREKQAVAIGSTKTILEGEP
jgi:hypothetical protein